MAGHHHIDMANATQSGVIGFLASFFMNTILPWAGHTIGAIASGVIVAYCVYKFNQWMKKREVK